MKRTKDTYVFLGPTLLLTEAQKILPADRAEYLPPAAVGDVYRLAKRLARRRRPSRIAIIDGYFERMAAIWHKEILYALECGILVYGAASMGALRAAELHSYGMIGVGRVFADYRAGRLTDDDEVAVAHAPAQHGYVRFSEAMVDLRAVLGRAKAKGVISARAHDTFVRMAKQQFYRDRTWETVLEAGQWAGVDDREIDELSTFLAGRDRRNWQGVKMADAKLLLKRLAREPLPDVRPKVAWTMSRTWFWHRFTELAEAEAAAQADPDAQADGHGSLPF